MPVFYFSKSYETEAKGWGQKAVRKVFTQHAQKSSVSSSTAHKPRILVHTFSPSTPGRESLVQSHLWLQSKFEASLSYPHKVLPHKRSKEI